MLPALPDIMLEPLVRAGLLEDLGRGGDLTTSAVLKGTERVRVTCVAGKKVCWRGWIWLDCPFT